MIMISEKLIGNLLEHPASKFWNAIFQKFPKYEIGKKYAFPASPFEWEKGVYLTNMNCFAYVDDNENIARIYKSRSTLEYEFMLKHNGENVVVDIQSKQERFILIGKVADLTDKGEVRLVNLDNIFIDIPNVSNSSAEIVVGNVDLSNVNRRLDTVDDAIANISNHIMVLSGHKNKETTENEVSDLKSYIDDRLNEYKKVEKERVEKIKNLSNDMIDFNNKMISELKEVCLSDSSEFFGEVKTGEIKKEEVKKVDYKQINDEPLNVELIERVMKYTKQRKGPKFIAKKLKITEDEVREMREHGNKAIS